MLLNDSPVLPKGQRPMSDFNLTWCFSDLYFSSKSESMAQEKKSLLHLRHLLAEQTQTRTRVLFLRSWQNRSQVTQLQRELSFRCRAYKLSYPESSALMKTVVLEWKPEQEGFLPWEFSMLCLSHTEDGDRLLIPAASTCHSHKTTLRIARILRWQWGLWREASQRHRALDKIKGLHHESLMQKPPPSKSPQHEPWALT